MNYRITVIKNVCLFFNYSYKNKQISKDNLQCSQLEKLIRISHFVWRIPHFIFQRYCSHSNMLMFVTRWCWLAETKLLGSHLFRQYSCQRYPFHKQYPPRQRGMNIQYYNWDQNISRKYTTIHTFCRHQLTYLKMPKESLE